ncbi:RICIN domain-containing protein [Micromonospora sp. NPDC126480]|uniref:RICIN domain-containing protein n=1 Tax=Micromonospora sp. NPDC126480 TaxID=3155312 RepID=UPI00332D1FBD
MPAPGERPDPSGTVYGRRTARPGLPRDPLMRVAVLVGVAGLLLGAFLATGVLGGGGAAPVVPAAAGTPSAGVAPTSPAGEPAPTTSTAAPSTAPTTAAARPTGPTVFRGVASGRCLGVDGDGKEAVAQLADCTGGPEQQWIPNPAGPDLVTLVNQASNLCLDVEGESNDEGAKLQQYPCHGNANQQWRIVPTAGDRVLLAALHSGRCARPENGGAEAGTDIRQATCAGVPEQQWQLA